MSSLRAAQVELTHKPPLTHKLRSKRQRTGRYDAVPQNRIDQDGAIAQLGERLNGIQEVGGSTPPGSTKSQIINLNRLGNVCGPEASGGASLILRDNRIAA